MFENKNLQNTCLQRFLKKIVAPFINLITICKAGNSYTTHSLSLIHRTQSYIKCTIKFLKT